MSPEQRRGFDEILPRVAASIQRSPGAYALLLGSGVSRSAGILTGNEIVLDLIRKLAVMVGEDVGADPKRWYLNRFREAPEYSNILQRLSATQTERMRLLYSYFEASEADRASGQKQPAEAHRAIAHLCSSGQSPKIRIIITTNFDRLLEKALIDRGISPKVVSKVEDLDGVLPLLHERCILVKVNGDYQDPRIRNLTSELASYPDEMITFLKRIFDESGLVICGWSASYDKALRDVLIQRSNRNFSVYWTVRGPCGEQAAEIITALNAETIPISSADQFFGDLCERIEALDRIERITLREPLSRSIAIEETKRYIQTSNNMRMHEMIVSETENIFGIINSDAFNPMPPAYRMPSPDFIYRMEIAEASSDVLSSILATMIFYGPEAWMGYLTESIERLISVPNPDGMDFLIELQRYPALLISYAVGTTAFKSNNIPALAALLISPRIRSRDAYANLPVIHYRSHWGVFARAADRGGLSHIESESTSRSPISDHIYQVIQPSIAHIFPNEDEYRECFELFEYLLGLVYIDQFASSPPVAGEVIVPPEAKFWGSSSVAFNRAAGGRITAAIDQRFYNSQNRIREKFLESGFFSGSIERLTSCQELYEAYLRTPGARWRRR